MFIFFKNFFNSIKEDYEDRRWGMLILKVLTFLFLTICTGIVIFIIASTIIYNLEKIIITIGSVCCIVIIFLNFFKKKEPAPESSDNSIIEYDPITLDTTYKMIRKNLCVVIGEVADIVKLRKPVSLGQMDTPTHYDVIAKAIIYHFIVAKQCNEIDLFDLTGILQNTIDQKLNNHELDGIPQTSYFYNGQSFPALMIDNIRDLGSFVQIDVAIASEYYCKYRESRIYNNMDSSSQYKRNDRDF